MEGYGGPAQPSPTIKQCLHGGYGWLEVKCHRCDTKASIPLDAISAAARYADLEIGGGAELSVVQKRPLRATRAHDQADAQEREITPYVWVHPDHDERR
jgi:hypothetical protein